MKILELANKLLSRAEGLQELDWENLQEIWEEQFTISFSVVSKKEAIFAICLNDIPKECSEKQKRILRRYLRGEIYGNI